MSPALAISGGISSLVFLRRESRASLDVPQVDTLCFQPERVQRAAMDSLHPSDQNLPVLVSESPVVAAKNLACVRN